MKRGLKIAKEAGSTVLLLSCVVAATAMFLPTILGYQRYVIVSGSMTGTMDTGSLVFDKEVPVKDLRKGDIITYAPPPGASASKGLITHRIVWVGKDREGKPSFRTKGDHNAVADPWKFTLNKKTQAKAVFHIPALGFLFAALSIPKIRMAVIGLPAILVALSILVGLWKEAGREVKRRREDQEAETAGAAA